MPMFAMEGTLDEIEFLVASDHRVSVLEALRDSPRDRNDLRGLTGASSPTMSRILVDFENRNWIERNDRVYRLTGLGAFVVDRLDAFVDAMGTEQELRDVWPWLPHDIEGFTVDLFDDVTVTRPNPGYPDRPDERRLQLIDDASVWRGFGMAMLGLRTLNASFGRFLDESDELRCDYIYPTDVFDELLAWDSDAIAEAARSESYTVMLHDGLPIDDRFEICIFDDRVTISCYDQETGGLQALVETTSPEMYSWAADNFERFRQDARPLSSVSGELSWESRP